MKAFQYKKIIAQQAANAGQFLWKETVMEHSDLQKVYIAILKRKKSHKKEQQTQPFCKGQKVWEIYRVYSDLVLLAEEYWFYPASFPISPNRLGLLMSICQIKS